MLRFLTMQTFAAAVTGLACIGFSVWLWLRAARAVSAWRKSQSPLYGEELASRVYSVRNTRLAAGAGVLCGILLILMALTGQFR